MTTATYEMYEAFEEAGDQDCEALRTPQFRDMTAKQKFNTGARYRRRSSATAGASGSHRRRHKVSCC